MSHRKHLPRILRISRRNFKLAGEMQCLKAIEKEILASFDQQISLTDTMQVAITDAPDKSLQALPISRNFQPNRLEQLFYVLTDEMLDHKHSICIFRIASKIFHVRLSQFFYLAFCRWAYCQT
jgi:hypothetical protein